MQPWPMKNPAMIVMDKMAMTMGVGKHWTR
jgi:hypothetical protein